MNTRAVIEDFKPLCLDTLLGFARVRFPCLIMVDVTAHTLHVKRWAAPPSKPMVGRDSVSLRDANGKTKYSPAVEFASRDARDRFSSAVLAGMDIDYPTAFADEEAVA
jgi:hypothetical protein